MYVIHTLTSDPDGNQIIGEIKATSFGRVWSQQYCDIKNRELIIDDMRRARWRDEAMSFDPPYKYMPRTDEDRARNAYIGEKVQAALAMTDIDTEEVDMKFIKYKAESVMIERAHLYVPDGWLMVMEVEEVTDITLAAM